MKQLPSRGRRQDDEAQPRVQTEMITMNRTMALAVFFCTVATGVAETLAPDGKVKQDKVSAPMVNNAWGNLYKFHQSRAHYRSGKTYLAWVGPDNHPHVSIYNH